MDVLGTIISQANFAAKTTNCLRRGTFACITRDGQIVASGINGDSHCTNLKGRCGCTHAEVRAVLSFYKHRAPIEERQYDLWVTLSPCTACANMCVYSQLFRKVVFLRPLLHDLNGIHILRRAGIEVVRAKEL